MIALVLRLCWYILHTHTCACANTSERMETGAENSNQKAGHAEMSQKVAETENPVIFQNSRLNTQIRDAPGNFSEKRIVYLCVRNFLSQKVA